MPFSLITPTVTDIPSLVSVWYAAFSSPRFEKNLVSPNLKPKNVIYKAVVSSSTEAKDDAKKDVKIVALMRLLRYEEGEYEQDWKTRWPLPLVEGMSEEVMGSGFLEPLARQHGVAVGGRAHYLLEVLAADPAYHGQGAGSMLLTWACSQADAEGLEIYLDGAAKAVPLYKKFGFVVLDCRDEEAVSEPMVRKPVSKTDE